MKKYVHYISLSWCNAMHFTDLLVILFIKFYFCVMIAFYTYIENTLAPFKTTTHQLPVIVNTLILNYNLKYLQPYAKKKTTDIFFIYYRYNPTPVHYKF